MIDEIMNYLASLWNRKPCNHAYCNLKFGIMRNEFP